MNFSFSFLPLICWTVAKLSRNKTRAFMNHIIISLIWWRCESVNSTRSQGRDRELDRVRIPHMTWHNGVIVVFPQNVMLIRCLQPPEGTKWQRRRRNNWQVNNVEMWMMWIDPISHLSMEAVDDGNSQLNLCYNLKIHFIDVTIKL